MSWRRFWIRGWNQFFTQIFHFGSVFGKYPMGWSNKSLSSLLFKVSISAWMCVDENVKSVSPSLCSDPGQQETLLLQLFVSVVKLVVQLAFHAVLANLTESGRGLRL